jgi:uncharacterized membrane protein
MMPSDFDLLRALDDEPRTPSTVDVARAMADGRRKRRTRRAAYAGAATATAFAVVGASVVAGGLAGGGDPKVVATGTPGAAASKSPKPKGAYEIPGAPGWKAPAASPPTRCVIEQLPTPDGEPMALVSGSDPTGKYQVGRSYPKGGGYVATVWVDGKAVKVDLPGDMEELLGDANSAGTAVGWSYASSGEEDDAGPVPYAYHNGEIVKLKGVKYGSAFAVNEAGAIVGEEAGKYPVVWTSVTAKPIRLPVPAGTESATANDIDEDGTVVGDVDRRAYVWFADGTHRALPVPEVDGKPADAAMVSKIRNGWAIGLARVNGGPAMGDPASKAERAKAAAGGGMYPVRWNLRTGEVRVVPELKMRAEAVNAQGWQVGPSQKNQAVLLADGKAVVLPGLPMGGTMGNALSDDGRTIGGQSDDKNGVIQAVVWHCE